MAKKLYMRTEEGISLGVPKELPERWKNYSGFNTWSDTKLKTVGWLPLVVVTPLEYDPNLQYRSLEYVVNEDNITPTYTIEDFLDVGRLNEWCSVIEGEITGGPFRLPKVWDGIQMWLLTEEEINDIGWFIYVDVKPEYDEDTEYLTHTNQVNATNITAIYTVNDYTAEQIADALEQAQDPILIEINTDVNTYINSHYDSGTQQSFTAIYSQQDTTIETKTYLDPVLTWITTIMTYYYGKKMDIINATTVTILKEITWDFTTFDATKPDVSLSTLMSSS